MRKKYFYLFLTSRIRYLLNYFLFVNKSKVKERKFSIFWQDRKPCLDDESETTPFDGHYLYHPAWAARIISKTLPKKHVDISSILYFSTLLSAFVPVDFYDFRPAKILLTNFKSKFADLTNLPFNNDSIESISVMHVLEHLGLGRYGDPIDPDLDLVAIRELQRVVKTGGNLLVVVPVGSQRIQYNAHRIYDAEKFIKLFKGFKLKSMSVLLDDWSYGLVENPKFSLIRSQKYACGCFWFRKI